MILVLLLVLIQHLCHETLISVFNAIALHDLTTASRCRIISWSQCSSSSHAVFWPKRLHQNRTMKWICSNTNLVNQKSSKLTA